MRWMMTGPGSTSSWNRMKRLESGQEDVRSFRRVAKDCYVKMGAKYIYCYADQGPSDLIGEYEDGTWEVFEAAIRTGKYLEDH